MVLTPTPSKQLIDLHIEHHASLGEYSNPESLYLPNRWTIHCTIANRLSHTRLIEAFDYCSKHLVNLHSEIVEIAVIKIDFDKNKAVGVSLICSFITLRAVLRNYGYLEKRGFIELGHSKTNVVLYPNLKWEVIYVSYYQS